MASCLQHVARRLPSARRRYQLFDITSFSARLSRVSSATTCLSFRFSSSSCLSFLVPLLSMPPYFASSDSLFAYAVPDGTAPQADIPFLSASQPRRSTLHCSCCHAFCFTPFVLRTNILHGTCFGTQVNFVRQRYLHLSTTGDNTNLATAS